MFNEVKSAKVVNIKLYHIGAQGAYLRYLSKKNSGRAALTFNSLMEQTASDKPLSQGKREAILDFLQEHLTYCDELLEHVLSPHEAATPSLTDEGNSYLDTVAHSAKAILERVGRTRKAGNLSSY